MARPPRERPRPGWSCRPRPVFRPSRRAVRRHGRPVDHGYRRRLGPGNQGGEDMLPPAASAPAVPAMEQLRRQRTPAAPAAKPIGGKRGVAADARGREVQGRPGRTPCGQAAAAGVRGRGGAVGEMEEAAAGRDGLDCVEEAALIGEGQQHQRDAADNAADAPCHAVEMRSGRRRASPPMTQAPGSERRRWAAMAGTISATNRRSAGIPERSKARETTPVPAPSSITASSGAWRTWWTMRWQRAAEEGTTEPIRSGLARQWRKNNAGRVSVTIPSSIAVWCSWVPISTRLVMVVSYRDWMIALSSLLTSRFDIV